MRRLASALTVVALVATTLNLGTGRLYGQQPQTGFPSLDINDGKFVALAGAGLSTVAQAVSFWIGLPADQATLTVDLFDGNLGGFWDVHDTSRTVRVNYTLFADPLKDGSGSTVVASKTDADFADDAWGTVYSGPVHAAARAPSGNLFYRLTVSFADPTAAANELNGFKIRVEGQVGLIPGTFGFVGAPINVDVLSGKADPALGTARNKYDGEWHWYVYASSAGTAVTFTDTDADSRTSLTRPGNPPDDCSPGATCFAVAPDIRYQVLDASGNSLVTVTAPSGDLETATRSVTASQAGFLDWRWTGVDGHNLVFIRSSHEVFASSAQVPLVGSVTIDPAPSQSTIKGRVYGDGNCNGVPEAGEGGLAGITVTIDSGGGWTARTASGPGGEYEFAGLSKGKFNLSPAIPAGYDRATPASREAVAVDGRVQTIASGADFGMATQIACSAAAAPAPPSAGPAAPVGEAPDPWPPQGPARTWYLSEGHTGTGFETRLSITNPGAEPATAAVTFFVEEGKPVARAYDILPASSLSLLVNRVLPGVAFSAKVEADQPVVVERTMRFGERGVHAGTGSDRLSETWYLPEVSTGPGADNWVLILNPNDRPASVELTFVKDDGSAVKGSFLAPASSRLTIYANSIMPEGAAFARVRAEAPVMVERSTYWEALGTGYNALAVPAPARSWSFARAALPEPFQDAISVVNDGATRASLKISFLLGNGEAVVSTHTVAPGSRLVLALKDTAPSGTLAVDLDSDVPVIAERVAYSSR